ncbi:hypothetical protein SAMN05421810_102827 [Amycolatopsis arida]|uniref:DUF6801 domain-containing protein n=1 Tax=Amycolatopsis arida TaxID=587909 RepID=A0A1I5R1M5_9PSEU|nr:DUF6801 domain-containing protein [Amycolatopsis arida]TDX99027.1 hypothetical protein CLV69_101828 [Amycolatopsis arida]SFP51956.1 hypothetical protein SAMN05421810_102827 [Amycolatopsis arida]
MRSPGARGPAARLAVAGLGAALSTTLLVAGAAHAGPVGRTVSGTCGFDTGSAAVRIDLTVTLPASVPAGSPVTVPLLAAAVVLPADLVDTLRDAGVTAVGGDLGVGLLARTEGPERAPVTVDPRPLPETGLPESGELRLPVELDVPPIPTGDHGAVTVELEAAVPALTVHKGERSDDVVCLPDPGQAGPLGTVSLVGGPEQAPAPEPRTPREARPQAAPPGLPASYWVDGRARIARLGSDLVLKRGRFDSVVDLINRKITGTLDIPPSPGYFVIFRFVPNTATAELIPDGPAEGELKRVILNPLSAEVDVTAKLFLRLRDVEVDKVPVGEGPDCRTEAPLVIRLQGTIPLVPGSPPAELHTTFDLPEFTGCGATEDLDPLLNGLIPGPDNDLRTTLSVRCITVCPPDEPNAPTEGSRR